ncbi:MAG: lytic transglycosylase domain-containing protein [Flavobacteriales bacterium]|jgi:hypothetical protein|nr:lytic transglycosylase domain-containing protein [Flavobacteriales bacterium]
MIYKLLIIFTFSIFSLFLLTNCEEKQAQEELPKIQENRLETEKKHNAPPHYEYRINAPKTPKDIHFCNEPVPVNQAFIYEKLDRELLVNMYWQSQTFLFIKRAQKWFPIIEPILKEHHIPDDFKYLALIESGLMNVTSPSGAKGFWQFMPSTAKGLNLEVNAYVDERYHVEKATIAACEYLNKAYQKFGSWTLAAASYNMGKAGLSNRLTQQKVKSYYDLLLNQETGRYVYRILAVKTILSNPIQYGFSLDQEDYYTLPDYQTITIDSSITNLVLFSKSFDMTYMELKALNPWLRDTNLPNKNGKTYAIKVLK